MILLSLNLAVLNLLPIPVLDGGHLVYFLVEGVTRRPVSERLLIFGQQFGLAVLFCLMGLAFYNDITRIMGSEKCDNVSHFFRFGHMSEGNRFREFVKRIIRINSAATETRSQHRCIDFIGTDGIDTNTVRGMIAPQIFGQCRDSRLTGAIGQMSRTRVYTPG